MKQRIRITAFFTLFAAMVPSAFAQNINTPEAFPDPEFRRVVEKTMGVESGGLFTAAQAAQVTDIDASGAYGRSGSIEDLTGIQFFTALAKLHCEYNRISTLNISLNTALVELRCGLNSLISLDVSNNSALESLDCTGNALTSLDISSNSALKWLRCEGNPLTVLDVSNNTALEYLRVNGPQLTKLDVSRNTALKHLQCYDSQLTSLDVSNNTLLEFLDCSHGKLTSLDVSNNRGLETLWCEGNRLTNLDVTHNTRLKHLLCSWNELTSISDFVANKALTGLDVSYNNLDSGDCNDISILRQRLGEPSYFAILWTGFEFSPQHGIDSFDCQALSLPALTGPYPVGTMTQHWVDEDRGEPATRDDPDDKRELMVNIWYPADVAPGAEPVSLGFYCDLCGRVVVDIFDLDPLYGEAFRNFRANAAADAPIRRSAGSYPLIVYSHGDGAFPVSHTFTMEELASHGYIVVAPAHTFNAGVVRFPDGRLVEGGGGKHHESRLGDLFFVLNRLEREQLLNNPESFVPNLDFTRIGIFGYSLGGNDAIDALKRDDRYRAVASIDGFGPFSVVRPFLNVKRSDNSSSSVSGKAGGYILTIQGANHFDFDSSALVWQMAQIPGTPHGNTNLDRVRMGQIYTEYILAFFEKHLKGRQIPLLDRNISVQNLNPEFPELRFRVQGDPRPNAPSLEIQFEHGQRTIALTWPVEPNGFSLQSSESVDGEWSDVEQQSTIDQDAFHLRLNLSESPRYFRLLRP